MFNHFAGIIDLPVTNIHHDLSRQKFCQGTRSRSPKVKLKCTFLPIFHWWFVVILGIVYPGPKSGGWLQIQWLFHNAPFDWTSWCLLIQWRYSNPYAHCVYVFDSVKRRYAMFRTFLMWNILCNTLITLDGFKLLAKACDFCRIRSSLIYDLVSSNY